MREEMPLPILTNIVNVLVSLFVFLMGALTATFAFIMQELPLSDGNMSKVIGPFGALVLSVIALGVVIRYYFYKEKHWAAERKDQEAREQKLIDDRIKKLEEDVSFWRTKALDNEKSK